MWKEEDILYAWCIGHQHTKTVYPDSHARGRRHAKFKGPDEIHINEHGFIITLFLESELFFEAIQLVQRIIQLGIGVGQFFPVDKQLKTFCQVGMFTVFFLSGARWR